MKLEVYGSCKFLYCNLDLIAKSIAYNIKIKINPYKTLKEILNKNI